MCNHRNTLQTGIKKTETNMVKRGSTNQKDKEQKTKHK